LGIAHSGGGATLKSTCVKQVAPDLWILVQKPPYKPTTEDPFILISNEPEPRSKKPIIETRTRAIRRTQEPARTKHKEQNHRHLREIREIEDRIAGFGNDQTKREKHIINKNLQATPLLKPELDKETHINTP